MNGTKKTKRTKSGDLNTHYAYSDKYHQRGNVWKYNTGWMHSTTDKTAYKHPAIFPEKLAKDHIYSWSNEGDLVYDPFIFLERKTHGSFRPCDVSDTPNPD